MILYKGLHVWVSSKRQMEFGISFLERMNWEAWVLTGWSGLSHVHQSKKILLILFWLVNAE